MTTHVQIRDVPLYQPKADECAVFETAHASGLPLLLKGPTGCGKTRFVEHMAARLNLPLYTVACHDDLSAADLIGRGERFSVEASKAKLFASEAAVKAANLAIQAFGGYGYVDEYPVQKYMRDARVMTLYEGTSQIQKLLIGRAETGISAFT